MSKKEIDSYMEMCLNIDTKENLYLRIPTVWDSIENQWVGFIKTPESKRLITGSGKTSFDLQNDFNKNISKMMQESEELGEEIYGMFMPAFYWE